MEFNSFLDESISFKIVLASNITDKEKLKELDKDELCTLLNPALILNSTHLSIAVEKAVHFSKKKLLKFPVKRDIIYFCCESGKYDVCLGQHNPNELNQVFIIYVNKTITDDEIREKLKCDILDCSHFSDYCDLEKIKKEFNICELELNSNSGIFGAVYNRISLKDLKF